MHLTILGAGAVGGTLGALLYRAGYPVTLVARGAHLEALRRDGLRLLTPAGEETHAIPTDDTVPSTTDLVLLAVKTDDIPLALTQVPDGIPIACLQNGLNSAAMVATAGHPAIAAMVWLPTTHLVPGEVRIHGWPHPGRVDVGDHPRGAGPLAHALAAALRDAGLRSDARPDIMAYKRGKLLTNLPAGLEAACGEVDPDLRARLVAEGEAIYRAADLDWVPPEVLAADADIAYRPAAGLEREGSSMWQSLTRGRPAEVSAIYDDLLALARKTHVDAALTRRLRNLVAELTAPGSWGADALLAALLAPSHALDVTVLHGLTPVRARPGMYIGDPGEEAARNMVDEVVGNVVDQHLAGRCDHLSVSLRPRGFTVDDDGPGIAPTDIDAIFTQLRAHGRSDRSTPHVHVRPGLAGCGLAVVNALAARCEVESRHGGRRWRRRFGCGRPLGALEDLGPTERTGLTVSVELDRTLLGHHPPDIVAAALLLERLAALTALRCTLNGAPIVSTDLTALVRRRAARVDTHAPPDIELDAVHDGVRVHAALWLTEGDAAARGWSWLNLGPVSGGTHIEGLTTALADAGLARRVCTYGLHVTLPHPRFRNPTTDWLAAPEAAVAVRELLGPALAAWRNGEGDV